MHGDATRHLRCSHSPGCRVWSCTLNKRRDVNIYTSQNSTEQSNLTESFLGKGPNNFQQEYWYFYTYFNTQCFYQCKAFRIGNFTCVRIFKWFFTGLYLKEQFDTLDIRLVSPFKINLNFNWHWFKIRVVFKKTLALRKKNKKTSPIENFTQDMHWEVLQ